MALLHRATLSPSKLELLAAWLPSRSWSGGGDVRQLGAYRFDDPAGQVGLEAFLLARPDGRVLHVPLSYRGEPLAGAEEHLVGLTRHSVLGQRWVYDGCGDPVWASALATALLAGGRQAEEHVAGEGPRTPSATVRGSGSAGAPVPAIRTVTCTDEGPVTIVRTDALDLVVVRAVGTDVTSPHTLTGEWAAGGPAALAAVRQP